MPISAALNLQVNSPLEDALVTTNTVTVAGITRPDATVSVNGILAVPGPGGNFTVELPLSGEDNPFSIEVIASSLTGEESSIVLTQIAAGGSLQPESQGLFGTISRISGDHPRAVAGETDIILATGAGPVELTATPATMVRIPGLELTSVDSLLEGDPVAVLVSQGRAISILVRGSQPLRTGHFTGIVTSIDAEAGTISLQSPRGESIKAPWLTQPAGLMPGVLVTAVMEQDLSSGGLVITGIDAAQASLERLASAMEKAETAGASTEFEDLMQRMLSNSARQLTILVEANERLEHSLDGRMLQELASSLVSNRGTLSRFGVGEPKGDVTGIVTSIDLDRRVITVEPEGLRPVDVSIPGDTSFWRAPAGLLPHIAESWLRGGDNTQWYANEFGGRESRFQQLDLANRVRLRYSLDSGGATRVLVLPAASVQSSKTEVLLELSARGAAVGTVTSVDSDSLQPTLKIQDGISGRPLTLSVTPESELLEGRDTIAVSALTGTSVDVSYDPATMSVLKLNSRSPGDRRERVYGVVHSFIPKVAPGNFIILTNDGDLLPFNHTGDTVIIRDGRRVTISQVRIGDLVQPETAYLPGNGGGHGLVVLSLKSPRSAPVRGTIRGITNNSGAQTVITITNNWLELINIVVDGDTQLRKQGRQFTAGSLAVGQRVLAGEFDPISGLARSLVIGPHQSLHIRGEITAVDASRSTISITPSRGEPIQVFVSDSTAAKIILPGIPDPYFGDLRQGQNVRIGFYDPATNQALSLVID